MSIENQILRYLKEHLDASPKEINDALGASRQFTHRVLVKLVEQDFIERIGKPPKVFYRLKESNKIEEVEVISEEEISFLETHFNYYNDKGQELNGVDGFSTWCQKQKLPFKKTVGEFLITRKKYLNYFEGNDFINGTDKLKNTKGFEKVCMDEIFYGDFYAIERFGKTKIGNLIHFAKQGQNKKLMEKISVLLKSKLESFIKKEKIEAVGFIPPTIKREVQLMTYLKNSFKFSVPLISITKVVGEIPIPQKALSKLEDRISNAKTSIVITDKRVFDKILLIDDAIGSGATINETACKLKLKKMATTIYGFAVVGSFKGFDVIQEV